MGSSNLILGGATESMIQRGKGQLGDKTILDAVDAARVAADGIEDFRDLVLAAEAAVAAAIDKYRDQPSRRARIFGERVSVGMIPVWSLSCVSLKPWSEF